MPMASEVNKYFLQHVNEFHEVISNQVTFLAKLLDEINFGGNVRVDRVESRKCGLNSACGSLSLKTPLVESVVREGGRGPQGGPGRCDQTTLGVGSDRWGGKKEGFDELGENPNKLFCLKPVPQLLALELSLNLILPGILIRHSDALRWTSTFSHWTPASPSPCWTLPVLFRTLPDFKQSLLCWQVHGISRFLLRCCHPPPRPPAACGFTYSFCSLSVSSLPAPPSIPGPASRWPRILPLPWHNLAVSPSESI